MQSEERLIRLPEVKRITGLGRSQIYLLATRGEFPSPLKLSRRCSAWRESAVRQWIVSRIASQQNAKTKHAAEFHLHTGDAKSFKRRLKLGAIKKAKSWCADHKEHPLEIALSSTARPLEYLGVYGRYSDNEDETEDYMEAKELYDLFHELRIKIIQKIIPKLNDPEDEEDE